MASLVLGILATSVMGISIKELLPTAVAFSWKLFLTYRHKKLISKLAKMVITYTEGKYPHNKILKEMVIKIKDLYKRHSKKEIVQTISYFKELKDLFYAVNFGDIYWEQNKDDLLVNPVALRDYMVKKIYIERIKDIIVVKLYNNIISKEDLQELETDLLNTFMNKQITIVSLDQTIENIERECVKQYKENQERYDKDFTDEKRFVRDILEKAKEGLPRVVRTALSTTQEIIGDCKNDLGKDNYTSSQFLKRTRSLSKTSTLEFIDEKSSLSSNPILDLLN